MAKYHPTFVGLPDTRKVRRAWYFDNAAQACRLLAEGKVATAANDHGAITLWRDKYRKYRCEAHRFLNTIDARSFTALSSVRSWTRRWLKAIKTGSTGQ